MKGQITITPRGIDYSLDVWGRTDEQLTEIERDAIAAIHDLRRNEGGEHDYYQAVLDAVVRERARRAGLRSHNSPDDDFAWADDYFRSMDRNGPHLGERLARALAG